MLGSLDLPVISATILDRSTAEVKLSSVWSAKRKRSTRLAVSTNGLVGVDTRTLSYCVYGGPAERIGKSRAT
jgi:hypothetical protein